MISTAVLLVSHGFQSSYEKAFTNALAQYVAHVTLAASVRTLFEQLDPRVRAPNILHSMDPTRSAGRKIRDKLRYITQLGQLLLANRGGVVHLIGSFLTTSIPLGVIELGLYRLSSKRLLLTVHNLLPHDRHSGINRVAAWLAYRIPHALVVHTERMRDELIAQWQVPEERIIIMEHGVDDIPDTQSTQPEHQSPDIKLLMFGGVAPYKGVDIAIEALSGLNAPPFHLAIVGACRDSVYRARIKSLVDAFPEPSRIEWIDAYIDESDVQAYFETADAVLLPYRHIDQSGVLFTAFRFGTPVIAFDVGSFASYINQTTGIVAPSNDHRGLQEALRQFHARRSTFERQAIKRYAEQFLWHNTVTTVLPVYQAT